MAIRKRHEAMAMKMANDSNLIKICGNEAKPENENISWRENIEK